MPASSPPQSASGPTGGILLIEDYNALRVAITSALRKFAPLHQVRVAPSFAEAEAIAAEMRPELFIADLDPPPAGELTFFNKLKAQHPDARVLVIAAGTSREIRAERGTSGGIQFIEKPFELPEFGAAVQALLGPWALPLAARFRGTLRDLHLVDVVQLKCLALATSVVRLETPDGRAGQIYFRRGQICHAIADRLSGVAAFEEIFRWPGGYLSEAEIPPDVSATINVAWPEILLPIVRRLAEENKRLFEHEPSAPTVAETGKKILIIDDTEMLRIFVADTLATAGQAFQILTAATGAEGIRLATAARPDLILLDYSLTDTTGDKVCRALRNNPATARIPVLMMSGHLSELARTARNYENVVASLPKPFLSGALINEVARVLAAGPLPEAPPAAGQKEAPIPADQPLPVESPIVSLPNGNGNAETAAFHPAPAPNEPGSKPAPNEPPPVVAAEPEPVRKEPPRPVAAPHPPILVRPGDQSLVRPTEVVITLALEVVALQLSPFLRMETATLQPCNPMVALRLSDQTEIKGVPLENGFRLGTLRLFDDGRMDTMRLLPMRRPPQLPAAKNSFAIGGLELERTHSHLNLRLTANGRDAMRVVLSAQCELLAVELSSKFEVDAVVLKPKNDPVMVRNANDSPGAPFAMEGVELSPTAELRTLLVRAAG